MKNLQIAISYFSFNSQVQSLEIEFEDDNYLGMPFVLLADGKWIKNKGFDFYVEFGAKTKQIEQVSLSLSLTHTHRDEATKDPNRILCTSSYSCCFQNSMTFQMW